VSDHLPSGTVTFLFTDIEGSTRSWEADADSMRSALLAHDALLNDLIPRHQGRVLTERGEGDSFFAVFARASDAVAAAYAIQLEVARHPWPERAGIRVRMAVHTGEGTGDYRGPDVNRCARLRALAHGGQVLLSATTASLVRERLPGAASLLDLGKHRLKDLTVPERVFQLAHPDLPAEFPPLRSLDSFRHNLPVQLTNFVGRQRELTELREGLGSHRLVTITGSGGSGKTRMALQVAADLLEECQGGVWFVDLSTIDGPGLITLAVAGAIGASEEPGRTLEDSILTRLRESPALLVLDNCEQVVEEAARSAQVLLEGAEPLRIMATSREALRVPGELVWRVPSLSLPEAYAGPSPANLLESESARLFLDRARLHRPGFELTSENAAAVASICERLDGIPLAIELAAARVRMLDPRSILERMGDRFALLTGGGRTALPRQQTLRAAVEWSYELLSEAERRAFRALSAFSGGAYLEAVEAVCASEPGSSVLDLLASLVDKSLVLPLASAETGARERYGMLETLRAFGTEALAKAGEEGHVRDRHLAHFLALAEAAYSGRRENASEWLTRLETDHDNIRASLEWARATDSVRYLGLAGALGWFWHLHSHYREGRARLADVLDRVTGRGAAAARAVWASGVLAAWQGDTATAGTLLERAVEMWREVGVEAEVEGLEAMAWSAFFGGQDERALALAQEALAIQRRVGDTQSIRGAMAAVCQFLVAKGDTGLAKPMALELLEDSIAHRDRRNEHFGYHFLADCALIGGDGPEAERLYKAALRAAIDYGEVSEAGFELQGLGMSASLQGRAREALVDLTAADRELERLGVEWRGVRFWRDLVDRWMEHARGSLPADEASAAVAEGAGTGFERRAREAITGSEPGPA
jgi:predicted ATPase/class 3 adenylate cyclase